MPHIQFAINIAFTDYYPFGSPMPGRNSNSADYRFGFQGQEQDNEIKGEGNSINYKYRVHDPRLGRFLSIDPLAAQYPFYSPYAFSGNRVIDMVELEGLEPAEPPTEGAVGYDPTVEGGSPWIGYDDGWARDGGDLNTVTIRPELYISLTPPPIQQDELRTFNSHPELFVNNVTYYGFYEYYVFHAPIKEVLKLPIKYQKIIFPKRVTEKSFSDFSDNPWGSAFWFVVYSGMFGATNGLVKSGTWVPNKPAITPISSGMIEVELANSNAIIRSVGAASRSEMLAARFKLNINSPIARQVLNSLDESVDSFISNYRKASIRSEFPGEFLNMSVEEALRSGNTTVRKLLIDGRFVK